MQIADLVRERGPMTVAAYMELALYHPELGYYARAARRSGRTGDFFTSVDVGPLFGELLAAQLAEMAEILNSAFGIQNSFDLVEAGAGNGRLSADILDAARARASGFYDSIRLHLSEVSPRARAAHASTLGDHAGRLVWSEAPLPGSFEGVLIANELLDALPVHQVVMREGGLREVYVSGRPAIGTDDLALTEGPVSTPALHEYLERLGVELQPVMFKQLRPRHAAGFKVVEQRSTLPDGQPCRSAREHYTDFFEQLTCGATNHRGRFCVVAVPHYYFSVTGFALPSGKGAVATEKSQLSAALHPEDFGSGWVGVGTEKNYGRSVFWLSRRHIHRLR